MSRGFEESAEDRMHRQAIWLVTNRWVNDSVMGAEGVVVLYQGQRYRPSLGLLNVFLCDEESGKAQHRVPITEYYDLVDSMSVIHPEDEVNFGKK